MHSHRLCAGLIAASVIVVGCGSEQIASPHAEPALSSVGTDVAAVSWSVQKQTPKALRAAAAASDGARIYLLGGAPGSSDVTTAGTLIYNPTTNTWTTGAPFAGARDFAMAAALSDGIHLLGGANTSVLSDHRVYSRTTNTWSTRPRLPTAVDAAVARVVSGKLYIIGGGTGGPNPTGVVQVYNPVTKTWVLKRAMPTPRLSAASAVINGLIYVAGGQTVGVGTTSVLERYDPVANTWTSLSSLPFPSEALSGGNVGGRFCVTGGRVAVGFPTGNAFATSYCYSPATDTWSPAPNMITPRVETACAEFGGSLYTFGGRTKTVFANRNTERLGSGVPARALEFSQSFVQVPDNQVFDLSSTWTLEAWVYPTDAGNGNDQDIISKWDGAPDAAYIMQIDRSGVLRLVTNDGSSQTIVLGPTIISNNHWHHLAATFSSGTVRLYLDGVVDKTVTGALTPINSSQPLAFGREGNFDGGTFQGRIDEIRIWKVVRTDSDLAAYRTKRLAGSETGLRGYWRLDEGAGQTVYDATGLRHNGQLGTTTAVDSWDPAWTTSVAPLN